MNPQQYYISEDIESILRDRLESIHAEHVFIVHGKGSYAACGAAAVMNTVCQGLIVTEYVEFSVNPKDEEAQKGVQLLLDAQPDVLIAVGGGSAMDISKLIRHYAAEQSCHVPLWAIPTTAGTGAEATHFAVVYKGGVKHSIEADDILPDIAILYPPFTYGNNAYLTACTGFDALAQAIEAYWNPKATNESLQYSTRAIEMIYKQLPECIAHPEKTNLRDELMQGAYWAGRAINITKTTAPHAFSYVFTSKYGYPHGHAVALTFPFFMKLNGTQDLFELLGMSADKVVQQMEEYISSLGLSLKLSTSVDITSALQEVNMQRLANNPVIVTKEIVSELESYLKNNMDSTIQQEDFSKYNGEGTPLRKAQIRMLEMLAEVDKICRKHNIVYWIDAGTLLGAVRHKGFIPWDDDVDVCVLRRDYARAREILMRELPAEYKFVDWTTDANYFDACGRVKSVKSKIEIPAYRCQKEQGIYIDFFPMEELVSMKDKYFGERIYGKIFRHYHNIGKAVTESKLRRVITKSVAVLCFPFVYSIIQLMRWYGSKHPNIVTYGFALCTIYPKYNPQWIFPTKDILFEGIAVCAPNDTHSYLTEFYGDYMKIPSPEKRITHSYNWKIW